MIFNSGLYRVEVCHILEIFNPFTDVPECITVYLNNSYISVVMVY